MILLNAVSSFPSFWLAYTILCQRFKWFGSCGLLRPEAFGRWRTEDFISCNLIMENAWTSAISVTHCDTLMQKSLIALLQAGSCTPICPGKATGRCLFKLFATDTCDVRTVKLKRWPRCMASKILTERTVVAAQISHLICIKNTSCEIWVSQHSLPITCVLISVQAPRINLD